MNIIFQGAILALLITASCNIQAQQKRFYIANDDHTDYMWSGNEAVYKNAMLITLDKYLGQIDSSRQAGLPFSLQSKYNCDGSFWLWNFEKQRSQSQMNRLIAKVKSGHITVPYNPLAVLYGGMPAEASLRGMYYAGYLQKKFGIDMTLGISMENQTLPLGLSSLWAGSGVKYSWKGICGCASKMNMNNLRNRDHELYYITGLDSQKVLMKWYSYSTTNSPCGHSANVDFGGYAEARCLTDYLIQRMRRKSDSTGMPVIGAFGYGWDDLQTYTNGFLTLAKTASNASEQVIVSNETDYFRDVEKNYGRSLPAETVAGGNEWDLYMASLAEPCARVKRSVEKLRTAEALATLVSMSSPGFGADLAGKRDSAWMSIGIYPEHDWTADGPVSRTDRAAFQRKMENNFSSYVDTLYQRSARTLGLQIKNRPGASRFYVFNALNWNRTDYADIPYAGTGDVAVSEAGSNKEVLHQVITKAGNSFLRIMAVDVPSVGYKVYEIRQSAAAVAATAASLSSNILENSRFRLTVTKQGVIRSLVDKQSNAELAAASPEGRFLNDMGARLSDAGSDLVLENAGPVSVTLTARASDSLRHISRITLFNAGIPRIDIENTLQSNFSGLLTNTFSFNLSKPDIWHEETGAVIKARLLSEGGHYAAKNARYEWLTMNHFASFVKDRSSITVSNRDCYFFRPGNSTTDRLDGDAAYISVLIGGQTDGANLGILKQGGDTLFTQQFSISVGSQADHTVQSMKAALESQQPLTAGYITGTAGTLPADRFSLVTVSDPGLILWALKPAEEGIKNNGIIARIWNLNDKQITAKLSFARRVSAATETTHLEVNKAPVAFKASAVNVSFRQQQMKTYRIRIQ